MSLYKAMQNLKFDKRLTERNLTVGQVTKEEWQQHLNSLPDMAHNVETIAGNEEAEKDALDN